MVCLLVCIFFVNIEVYMLQGKKKYNIDIERLAAILRERGWPPPDASRSAPTGYWFLIASALSNCNKPCSKYVLAVYKCWQTNRGNVRTSVGNYEANDWYSIVTCIYSR